MKENKSIGKRSIGDIAPKLVGLTDYIVYGNIWECKDLSKQNRSLITVATLAALNRGIYHV